MPATCVRCRNCRTRAAWWSAIPPYDARLAADPALYRALGDGLKRTVPQWRASLLCGDPELARATGLRAQKKYQLFNGAIECTLIVCDPVAPPQRERSDEPQALSEGAQMVANRLRKNLKKLKAWREREDVACYRAYDADLPEYSAAIDVYTSDPDGQVWLHVQEYAAPAEIPEATTRRRLNELLAAARDVFALPKERIALKTRSIGKGGSKYGNLDQRGEFLAVREGDARLRVNLFDYLDTGLFLDHRPLRLRIAEEAQDTRFLNLFGYTGAATVHAAVGGARSTTTVDLSATYLQWCADNLKDNGIGGTRHRLAQADALTWLDSDHAEYDLIFCDPPTFSNSKRADDFDIQREHVRLLRAAVARLARDGVLYFSNNFRRFRLDAAAIAEFAECVEISADTIPPDFARDARIHRCWRLRRLDVGALMFGREHREARRSWWALFRQWLRDPLRTASVMPSSRELAAAMLEELPPDTRRVIELGGGTGALTRALLAHGIHGDALLVLELNEELHAHLHARFPQVRVAARRCAATAGNRGAGTASLRRDRRMPSCPASACCRCRARPRARSSKPRFPACAPTAISCSSPTARSRRWPTRWRESWACR